MGVLFGATEHDRGLPKGDDEPSGRQKSWRSGRVADLSAGVVHEVRNPLNAIAIHVEVLSDKLRSQETGKLPPSVEPNLEAIRKQIHRLDDIMRRFSDFAEGRSDQRSLTAILESALALCTFSLRRRGQEAVLRVDREQVFAGETASISLAVVELILLGAEAADVGATIRIEAEVLERDVEFHIITDPASALDANRLAMVGDLIQNRGGRLERGEDIGGVCSVSFPIEWETNRFGRSP